MRTNIGPVFRRELKAYFYNPVAWLILFTHFALGGFFWAAPVMSYAQYSAMAAARGGMEMKLVDYLLAPYLGNTAVTFIMLLPLISMRLFSEEKKSGTIETLLTLPFSDLDLVLGKWLASLTVLAAMLSSSLLNFALIADKVDFPWAAALVGLLGVFLLGAACLSAGLLSSALTENQLVAAGLGIGLLLFLFVLNWVGNSAGDLKPLIDQVSILSHLQDPLKGVLNARDVSYFILFSAFMLFATLRVLESKKWR